MLMGGLIGIIMDRGSIWQIISWIISSTVVVLLVLPVHEFAHGLAATKLGDPRRDIRAGCRSTRCGT